MRTSDVSTVLDFIAGFDGRAWTPSAREAWAKILAPYPLEDAMRAVTEHYAVNEGRVMPAHIRTRCTQLRDLRAAEEKRALPAPVTPTLTARGIAARAEVRRLVGQVAGRMDAAMREPMRADVSTPTSDLSDITDDRIAEAIQRVRALQGGPGT